MIKLFKWVAVAVLVLAGYTYFSQGEIPYLDQVKGYVENGEILTLEARLTPEQILEQNKKELYGKASKNGEGKDLQDPLLKFAPYLLLDVKYLDNQKSREGILLWSLLDGEMVLNADTWEKTHGFHDAIEAGANKQDFRLLNALASQGGTSTKEKLLKDLHVESSTLDSMIEGAKKKHLVVVKGSEIRLHFQNPNFLVTPETKIKEGIVTKPRSREASFTKRYTKGQIDKLTQAAFGDEFKIRSAKEVFLPIYQIQVQNADGSYMTTFWNAVTGKKITMGDMR